MNKTMKDILIIVAAVVVAGVSIYFIYRTIVPTTSKEVQPTPQTQQNNFTGEIDTDTLKMISDRKDYGEATLDNIGRTNPFGPLN